MTVKIVLPKNKGEVSSMGTKVFDSDGVEIKDILSARININPDSIVTVTIEIPVSEVIHE